MALVSLGFDCRMNFLKCLCACITHTEKCRRCGTEDDLFYDQECRVVLCSSCSLIEAKLGKHPAHQFIGISTIRRKFS